MNKQLLVLAVILAISFAPSAMFCGFVGAVVYMIILSGGNLEIRFFDDRIVFHSHGGGYSGAFMP